MNAVAQPLRCGSGGRGGGVPIGGGIGGTPGGGVAEFSLSLMS
jgi:hypothetical protein